MPHFFWYTETEQERQHSVDSVPRDPLSLVVSFATLGGQKT